MVETTTRKPPVTSLTKPLSRLNLPTPVIVGNLQLMLSDSRYDYELSQDLVKGFSYGFRIPFCGPLDHAYQPRNHPSVFNNSYYVQHNDSIRMRIWAGCRAIRLSPVRQFHCFTSGSCSQKGTLSPMATLAPATEWADPATPTGEGSLGRSLRLRGSMAVIVMSVFYMPRCRLKVISFSIETSSCVWVWSAICELLHFCVFWAVWTGGFPTVDIVLHGL